MPEVVLIASNVIPLIMLLSMHSCTVQPQQHLEPCWPLSPPLFVTT